MNTNLDNILNDCPYRQHSAECKKFHKAMLTAQPKIEALIAEARIDELETLPVIIRQQFPPIQERIRILRTLKDPEADNEN